MSELRDSENKDYTLQATGSVVERFNRTLQQMLTSYANEKRNNWDEKLPYVLMVYRSSIQVLAGLQI